MRIGWLLADQNLLPWHWKLASGVYDQVFIRSLTERRRARPFMAAAYPGRLQWFRKAGEQWNGMTLAPDFIVFCPEAAMSSYPVFSYSRLSHCYMSSPRMSGEKEMWNWFWQRLFVISSISWVHTVLPLKTLSKVSIISVGCCEETHCSLFCAGPSTAL